MSIQTCFIKAKAYFKEKGVQIADADLRAMAEALAAKRGETLSPVEFQKAAQELFKDRMLRLADARRAARVINLERATRLAEIGSQFVQGQSAVKNIAAVAVGGSQRVGDSLNVSTKHTKTALIVDFGRGLLGALGENLKVAESGLLIREITQDMAHLESKGGVAPSGNTQALAIAKAYHGVLARIFEVKSAFDPFLGKIEDYFYRASHDRAKIAAVGKAQWVADAMSAYGEKSFPELSPAQKRGAFERVYDDIAAGRYGSLLEGRGKPGGDIMTRMARERTLIPNDWQAFADYNAKYGQTNVHLTMMKTIERAAQDIAALQKWGAIPQETFDHVLNVAAKQFPEQAEDIFNHRKQLQQKFEQSVFISDSPAHSISARIERGLSTVEHLALGNKTLLSSAPDFAWGAGAITDTTGGNLIGNMTELALEFWKRFLPGGEGGRAELEDLWLWAKAAHANVFNELGGSDLKPGLISKLIQLQPVASLVDRYHTSMSGATGAILSRRLARFANSMEYGQLHENVRGALLRYGIKEAEWTALREARQSLDLTDSPLKDQQIMTPEALQNVPDAVIADYARKTGMYGGERTPPKAVLTRARTDLSTKLGALINDHADISTSTAGHKEFAAMYGGVDQNTLTGAAWRAAMQFKSSALKTFDTAGRLGFTQEGQLKGDWTKVAGTAVMGAALWAFQDTLKQLLMGKTPEEVTPAYLAKAMASSGAGGVLAETIISEMTDRHGAKEIGLGIVRSLAGPGLTALADTAGVVGGGFQSLGDGREKFPGKELGALVQRHVPLQNLFYTQAALNFYVLNAFREALAPGYLGNMQRATERRGQSYFAFPPTESPTW